MPRGRIAGGGQLHPLAVRPGAASSPFGPAVAAMGRATPATEEVLWEGGPSTKALTYDMVKTGIFAVIVPLAVFIAYAPALRFLSGVAEPVADFLAQSAPGLKLAAVLLVVAVVGLRLVRLGWRILVLRNLRYRVSNQRVLIESGVFSKTIDELDMRTVEDILFRQSFLERLLGIGQITIVAADRTLGRVHLVGIPDAREVRERIRASAYQATGAQLFTRST